ncbi:tetratricopeptide repeat protein [Nocardioides pacificus]
MEYDEQLQAPALVFPGQPGNPASAYRVAYDLLTRRAPREAMAVIEPALEQDPRATGLRILRAWALLMQAHLVKAEEALRELVEELPGDDWVRHALGRSLERQSKMREALPHLRLAAAMSGDPEHELAVLRVERLIAQSADGSLDDLR